MKKTAFVITEGESDRILLQALLGVENQDNGIRVVAAGGWSSADSLARSVLMRGTDDVALVVDADTLDPRNVQERRQFLHRSLGEIVSSRKSEVIVIAPEIEVLLFEDRHILEAVVGRTVSEEEMIRGKFEPAHVLKELLHGRTRAEAFQQLSELDLTLLHRHVAVQQLRHFLQIDQQRVAA